MNIGACWIKEKDGKRYFGCMMNFIPTNWDGHFAIFKNDNKEKETHPDYSIVAGGSKKKVEKTDDDFQDDVPF